MLNGHIYPSPSTTTLSQNIPYPPRRPRRRSSARRIRSTHPHRFLALLLFLLSFAQTVNAQLFGINFGATTTAASASTPSAGLNLLSSLLGFTVSNTNTPLNLFCSCDAGLLGGLFSFGHCTSDLSCLIQNTCAAVAHTASQILEIQVPAGLMAKDTDLETIILELLGQCQVVPVGSKPTTTMVPGVTVTNKNGVTFTVTQTAVLTTTTFITQAVTTTTTVAVTKPHKRAAPTTTAHTTSTTSSMAPSYTTTTTTMVAVVTAYRNNAVVVTASSTITPTSTTSTTVAGQSGAVVKRRETLEEETAHQHRQAGFICPVGRTACRASVGSGDYECVDTLNDISEPTSNVIPPDGTKLTSS